MRPKSRRLGIQSRTIPAGGQVGVTQAPWDGRADKATCTALAEVPGPAVAVMIGQSSRGKTLLVAGDASELSARLDTP